MVKATLGLVEFITAVSGVMRANGICQATVPFVTAANPLGTVCLTLAPTAVTEPAKGMAHNYNQEAPAPTYTPEELADARKRQEYLDIYGREPSEAELLFYKDLPTLLG